MMPAPTTPVHTALLGLLLLAGAAGPATAQHAVDLPADPEPFWLHVTPVAGATIAGEPGDPGRVVAGLQLEASHVAPVGIGVAGGWVFPDDSDHPGAPDGPFLEALFVYRFHLQLQGRLSPYAGPVAGIMSDDVGGGTRELRWHFGGRGGLDIPVPGPWPTLRIELSFRHLSEAGGAGASDDAVLLVGGRWSVPLEP